MMLDIAFFRSLKIIVSHQMRDKKIRLYPLSYKYSYYLYVCLVFFVYGSIVYTAVIWFDSIVCKISKS